MPYTRLSMTLAIMISLLMWGCNSSEEPATVTYTDDEGNAIELISDKNLTVKKEQNLVKAYTQEGELFTGEQKLYHHSNEDKGTLRSVRTYENGMLMQDETYNEEGKIIKRVENRYENDKLAASTYFYPNGSIKSELVYASSTREKNGKIKEWHENGQLKFKMSLDSLNRYDGEMVLYDDQGDVVKKEIYEAGELVES